MTNFIPRDDIATIHNAYHTLIHASCTADAYGYLTGDEENGHLMEKYLPPELWSEAALYVLVGQIPQPFLRFVLDNNLFMAVQDPLPGDPDLRDRLADIIRFFKDATPDDAFGTMARADEWCRTNGLYGRR
jgi:hypothetical protein